MLKSDFMDDFREADHAISCGDFDKAWSLLQNALRRFRMVPGLAERERLQLGRLVRLLERMKRGSSYEPLDQALESAREMYEAHHGTEG